MTPTFAILTVTPLTRLCVSLADLSLAVHRARRLLEYVNYMVDCLGLSYEICVFF